ncbi:MAG: YceI family protein, partial [Bacteroidota bacterium]
WTITEDYNIYFDGSGASGTFSGLEGTIQFEPNNLAASKIDVHVDASTISTGNGIKDKHARGDKWFDVENYPEIRFASEKFTKTDTGYEVIGVFELHGITQKHTIPFTFVKTSSGGIFEGKTTINRYDYDIKGPLLAATVGRDFEVTIRVPVN